MDQERGIFEFRYYRGIEEGKNAARAKDIENLTSSLIEDSNGKLSFDEALAKAKIMLKIDS